MPISRAIRVTARRIARSEVPTDIAARTVWLDTMWLAMDRWVDEQLT